MATKDLKGALQGVWLRHRLNGRAGPMLNAAWSPDGTMLATGSQDRTVVIWDPETGQRRRILEGHTSTVESVGFSNDSSLFASMSEDSVRLWRRDTWKVVVILHGRIEPDLPDIEQPSATAPALGM